MDRGHTLHINPDSSQVKAEELQPGVCYSRITAVDPVMEDEDLGSRRKRIFSLSTEVSVPVYLTASCQKLARLKVARKISGKGALFFNSD
ncbi:hypothetical protein L6164_022861 [Bauhinia variegata]|uniref:Uncharacterized protein n=1 Tax=Bauhinia variegata TaxID=167791 RepID=A0ACB9MJV0_BAUVA|nr:hypothetical protein L6164_022861 [Bauhinia variegata]